MRRGEVVGLLGPNGAGKTTTFNMIVGGVRPDAGQVLLGERDVTSLPMYRRARLGVVYLPQEPSVFRRLTVADNMLAILETVEPDETRRRERLEALLSELGIADKARQRADSLSGGERRRVEIARALVLDPKFLLLDEPFTGIDPIAVIEIQKIVEQLKERGIGIVITEHKVRETLAICDRAYIIKSGRIIREGTPARDRGRPAGARDLPRGELPARVAGKKRMAIELKQQLKLTQQLVMTPQLQQAIKLLQLSRLELLSTVQQELEENPVLEESFEEDLAEEGAREDAPAEATEVAAASERESAARAAGGATRCRTWTGRRYGEGSAGPGPAVVRDDEERPGIEAWRRAGRRLQEHLEWQLQLASLTRARAPRGAASSSATSTRTATCAPPSTRSRARPA